MKPLAAVLAWLLLPGLAAAVDLTLRVNDLDALPGTRATLEIRTYSPRPVSQGQICLRSRSVARRATPGRAANAAAIATSPFSALLGGQVFSEAGDAVARIFAVQQGSETVWMVEFESPTGSVNAVDGPMIELEFELRADLDLGQEFEVSVDLANTVLFGAGAAPLELRSEPGRVRIRADDSPPGTLGFTSATFSTNEDVGRAQISVARTGGDDGAVGVSYLVRGKTASAADFTPVQGSLQWADDDLSVRSFGIDIASDTLDEPLETVELLLLDPTGGATLGLDVATLEIEDSQSATPSGTDRIELLPADPSAIESLGTVRVRVVRRGIPTGSRSVVLRTAEGSATAGEDFEATELRFTWDAGEVGERIAQLTLLDDVLDEGSETFLILLEEDSRRIASTTVTIVDNDASPGAACTPSATVLCLQDGRFQVSMSWHLTDGTAGNGRAATLARESGTFWFFDPANVEVLVKVLDGCSVPGLEAYWVFAAATTDVGYRLEVTDLLSGVSRSYDNPAGQAAIPIQDTVSFQSCP